MESLNSYIFDFAILNGTPQQLSRLVLDLPQEGGLSLWTPPDSLKSISVNELSAIFVPGNEVWCLYTGRGHPNYGSFRLRDMHTPKELLDFVSGTALDNSWTIFLWGDGGAGNLCFALTTHKSNTLSALQSSSISKRYSIANSDILSNVLGLLYGGNAPGHALAAAIDSGKLPIVACDRFGEYVDSLWPHGLSSEIMSLGELFRGEGELALYAPQSWGAFLQMCSFAVERQRELVALPGDIPMTSAAAIVQEMAGQNWTQDVNLSGRVDWIFAAARGGGEVANQYFVSTNCGLRRRVFDNLPGQKLIACF
jgi:hypothetical protein